MKRIDVIKTIEAFGCDLIRHGAKHDWYRNPITGISNLCHATGKSKKD